MRIWQRPPPNTGGTLASTARALAEVRFGWDRLAERHLERILGGTNSGVPEGFLRSR
jgi:hypothetical protein